MVKGVSSLLLSENLAIEHEADILTQEFKKSFEKVLNDNQHREKPYFLVYHDNDDKCVPGLIRAKFTVYDRVPDLMTKQMCFWVDNKNGFTDWVWTVDSNRDVKINTKGIAWAKAKGALRKRR